MNGLQSNKLALKPLCFIPCVVRMCFIINNIKNKQMKVKEIIYNWFQCGSTQDRDGAGEDWSRITVGTDGVKEIIEHLPQGEGDKFNYLVNYEDGSIYRVFNPNTVEYFKPDAVS